MGWIWSSGSAPKGNTPDASSNGNSNSNTENKPAPSTASAPESESTYDDPEVAKFMAQIQQEFGGGSSNSTTTSTGPSAPKPPKADTTTSTTTPLKDSSSSSLWRSLWPASSSSSSSSSLPSQDTFSSQISTSTSPTPEARLDPVGESQLPTNMSCRQAFDQAYHCNSLGGQWTAVYREGTMRSCSEQWDDFWFCMRTRAYTGAFKEEAIKDHYRQKELKKYGPGRPNSTDIWDARSEKLPVGAAFQNAYVKPDIDDEEWRRQEIERRRMVQRMLREQEDEEAAARASMAARAPVAAR